MTLSVLSAISYLFGWIYTIAWSLSFYPQALLNLSRRSTSGATIDFPAINVLGFLAYLVSNIAFLYSPTIRQQYAARNHGLTPTVQFNDVAFAAHATVISIIIVSQYVPGLWWEQRGRAERVSRPIVGIFIGSVVGVGVVATVVALNPTQDLSRGWAWIDVVSCRPYLRGEGGKKD